MWHQGPWKWSKEMARVRAISCNSKISFAKSNSQLLAIILLEVLAAFDTILASFFWKPCLQLASRTPHSPSFLSASLTAFLPSPFAGFPSTLMCQRRCMKGLSLCSSFLLCPQLSSVLMALNTIYMLRWVPVCPVQVFLPNSNCTELFIPMLCLVA